MQIYNKKQELADWIRRRLGAPILKAVPLAPVQLDDIIDEAVMYGGEHMGGIGNEEQMAIIWTKDDTEINETNLLQSNDDRSIKNSDIKNNPTSMSINTSAGAIIRYKQEYQLPRSVIALSDFLSSGGSSKGYGNVNAGASNDDQSLLDTSAWQSAFGNFGLGGVGGLGGGMGTATTTGLFVPGGTPGFDAFGTRGGMRGAGGGVDLVSYMMSMQYLEMVKQMFTVKMRMEFLDQQRRIRFSPAPPRDGFLVVGVWARVGEEWMYENLWVRKYACALAKKQIAYNGKLYAGATFPGGVSIDWDFYLSESKEEIAALDEELVNGKYSLPPSFYKG
jgi:hypothetical protein